MICPNCRKEIQDNSKFCNNCGVKIETKENVVITESKNEENKENNKPKTFIWYYIFVYLVLPIQALSLLSDILKVATLYYSGMEAWRILTIIAIFIIEIAFLVINIMLIIKLSKKSKNTMKYMNLKLWYDFVNYIVVAILNNLEKITDTPIIISIIISAFFALAWVEINKTYFENRQDIFVN